MRPFFISIITCLVMAIVPISCKQQKSTNNTNEFQKSAKLQKQIKASFNEAFPDPINPYKESPSIGSTGELITNSPRFLLDGIAHSDFSQLQSWAQPLIKSLDIESMTFSYFEDIPELKEQNIFPSMGVITYKADGTIEAQTGLSHKEVLKKATFKGEPIQTK